MCSSDLVVKAARQKPHHVMWTDRDGSERRTVLTPADHVRLATLAGQSKVSKGELLRQVAHIPVTKPPAS